MSVLVRKLPKNRKRRNFASSAMIFPYLAFMVFCGIIPLLSSLREVANPSWLNLHGGFSTIYKVLKDFRVIPALSHTYFLLLIFLPLTILTVLVISLLLDAGPMRGNTFMRLIFMLPGLVTSGIAVFIWTTLLTPHVMWSAGSIRWLIGAIAFTSGVGSWIVIQYGSLRSISPEVLEAARVDGCNRFQLAIRIKLPMVSRYIGYMSIFLAAGALQIFAEPMLLTSTGFTTDWSLNQVAYSYAFKTGDFAAGSALAIDMLVPNIILGIIFILRTDFLKRGDR